MELETKTKASNPSPNYLLSLKIRDFRCFTSEQTLNLSDGKGHPARWTVILGDNGTGKTTLLRCFAAIDLAANYPFVRSDVLDYLNLFGYFYKTASDISAVASYDIDIQTPQSSVIETIEVMKQGSIVPRSHTDRPTIYGYGASRKMGASTLSDERHDLLRSSSLFSDDTALTNAEEWLLQMDYSAHVAAGLYRRKASERVEQIKQLLITLLPDVQHVEIVVPSFVGHNPRVEFSTRYGTVSIHDLSLGYRTMVAWMVDLARRMFERYPDSPNPLAEPAIVLVDEIDLHLHPQWQRDLIRFLTEKFPNTQFIVTAHSAIVVQSAADANIVLLRPYTLEDGTQSIEICNHPADIRGYRVDQVLTSDLFALDSSRSQHTEYLLNERRKILSQPTLTEQDKERVQQLEAEIGSMPGAESKADIEAMEIIRRAAELLKSTGGSPG